MNVMFMTGIRWDRCGSLEEKMEPISTLYFETVILKKKKN